LLWWQNRTPGYAIFVSSLYRQSALAAGFQRPGRHRRFARSRRVTATFAQTVSARSMSHTRKRITGRSWARTVARSRAEATFGPRMVCT
jgi:hypothetical protein